MEAASAPVYQTFVLSATFFAAVLLSLQFWPLGLSLQSLLAQNQPSKSKAEIQTQRNQLANRITGVVHNAIQIPFALYLLMDERMQADHLYSVTPASSLCISITVGYFIVDSIVCLTHLKAEGPLFLFHALASLILYSYGAIYGVLHYYGIAFLMWEVSTPFVHTHWLLHKLDMHDSKVYFINGLLMVTTFFTVRCVYGVYLSWDFWILSQRELRAMRPGGVSQNIIWLYRLVNIGLNSLNFWWMTKMVRKAYSFIKQRKNKTT